MRVALWMIVASEAPTLSAGELFSETNDNSLVILLSYSTARGFLAGDAEAREEHRRAVRTRGLKRSSTIRNYTHSEPRFRALLTDGEARVLFHREASNKLGEA